MISLLHPSRSRIDKSEVTTAKWLFQKGDVEVELIVSVDEDDPQLRSYMDHYPANQIIVNRNRSAVDAINNAAKVAKGDILIVLSDDTDCCQNWGELILQATHGHKDYVLRIDDGYAQGIPGTQEWIITAPILDRHYYNRFGYVYYPGYLHQFCDTEFSNIAYCLKKVIRTNDIVFRHLHPSILKEKRDEVMLRSDATWNHGKQLYIERFKRSFDLPIDPWDFKGESHMRWLKHNVR